MRDERSGVTAPAAILNQAKDPDAPPQPDDLRDMQLRTFATLRKLHDDKETLRREADSMQKNDATRAALPFYLGDDVTVIDTELSPDARWLLVVTEPKSAEIGFEGKLTRYVTESGHEEFDKERVRVGRNPPAPQSLLLLNLTDHSMHALSLAALPGIFDDPLKAIREENARNGHDAAAGSNGEKAPSAAASQTATTAAPEQANNEHANTEHANTMHADAEHADVEHANSAGANSKPANNGHANTPQGDIEPANSAPPDTVHRTAGAAAEDGPKPRGVLVKSKDPDGAAGGVSWSADGLGLAIQFRSIDNKDRWLATVDLQKYTLVPQHRLTDAAWINWDFNDFGWLRDNRTLWFESEESGFDHVYTKSLSGAPHALTQGRFEVSSPTLSEDGRWFYVLCNAEAPYAYDVYRVPAAGGELRRITRLEGVVVFGLERRGASLLVLHSSSYIPPQVAVVKADGSGATRELTDTRTADYRSVAWIEPDIVQVPSTHFNGSIFAKVYGVSDLASRPGSGQHASARPAIVPPVAAPPSGVPSVSTLRPAVVFVHGAGYTQNVHLRFPYYFREQMFHNLLVQRGYVVIDLDYRASAGYGRDWRTAIYRQMGHPELEDLLDGKQWLVAHAGVDPKRVGIYGGSYGGFMTLMALFRAPGEFTAGAALRPVTDWMQYEHDYTSAILNDPQVDPIAYQRSSPIEFAAGLQDPLLICHGVIDDNVLFEDSMRLYQRLIELHKDHFTISPYALDSHGFVNADSWLDEYKRVHELFESTLRPRVN